MAKTISRQECPNCRSKDNLTAWEYQGKHYQRCQTPECKKIEQVNRDKYIEECMEKDNEYMTQMSQNLTENCDSLATNCDNIVSKNELLTGEYKATRGLTKEICEACGIMMQGDNHIFQYKNAQKVRFPKPDGDKGMYWVGNHQDAGMFLLEKDYDTTREIIITEGEIDAGTVYQAGYQSASIRDGAGEKKTAQEIKDNLGRINSFSSIIFWFDNDAAGQKAIQDVLEVDGLALWKVKIVKGRKDDKGFKDANEWLMGWANPKDAPIREVIEEAQEYIPEGLVRGDNIDFSILEEAEEPGIPFSFPLLQQCLHGLRKGEILLIGAASGAGKTLFVKTQILNWMLTIPDLRIANIFLEETATFTYQSLVGIFLNKPAHSLVENPYKGLSNEAKQLLGHKKYYFEEHFGSLQSKKLFKKIRYLAHKVDLIVIDHISIIVSGLEGNDERKDIDRLMTVLKMVAIETGVRFIIISHLRRANGDKTYEEGMPITANSFRGSHSLYQLSNSVIGLERNQQAASDSNKSTIRVLKNRFTGKVGLLDQYVFDEDKGIIVTLDEIFNDR